jgi:7-cyano-7-deazaguanine synthase
MSDLLLLSGGLDSISLAAWLKPAVCVTVDYGQRASVAEVTSSASVCAALGLPHVVLSVPLHECSSGLMYDGKASSHSNNPEFWPFRNQFLLTVGAMYAMKHGHRRVVIGTVVTDSRHGDGTHTFLARVSSLLSCQEGGISVDAPAIELTSEELVRKSGVPHDVLAWAHSCHISNTACGDCPGCWKHTEVMNAMGWNR